MSKADISYRQLSLTPEQTDEEEDITTNAEISDNECGGDGVSESDSMISAECVENIESGHLKHVIEIEGDTNNSEQPKSQYCSYLLG